MDGYGHDHGYQGQGYLVAAGWPPALQLQSSLKGWRLKSRRGRGSPPQAFAWHLLASRWPLMPHLQPASAAGPELPQPLPAAGSESHWASLLGSAAVVGQLHLDCKPDRVCDCEGQLLCHVCSI